MASDKWTLDKMPDQSGKVVLVTGANSGLGFETALALAGKGAHVLLAARSRERTEAALERIRERYPQASIAFLELDLADLSAIQRAAESVIDAGMRLDLLINNAGVMALPYRQTKDGLEMQFGTNHLGHFALTGRLLPALLAAPTARVVTVSSGAHQIGSIDFDNLNWDKGGYNKWRAYGRSKLANLLFAYELQRRFKEWGCSAISVAAHPGYAATNLQSAGPKMENSKLNLTISTWLNRLMAQGADIGALPQLYAATAPDVLGGQYFGPDGLGEMRGYPVRVTSNRLSQDRELASRLWTVSEELTGVHFVAETPKEDERQKQSGGPYPWPR